MYLADTLRKVREQRILHDVTLELTYRCNLDCFYCYNDRDKPGTYLSIEQYKTLLDDLAEMQTLFLMLTGGEPMMHPGFFEIGNHARKLGFVTRIRTNGHSLNKRLAKRLKEEVDPYIVEVSLHGATAEVHDRQTRVEGSFERLVKNIKTAREVGLRCNVVSTPTAWNEHQIKEMFSLCDSLNVPLRFQGPVAPRDNGDTEPLIIQPKPETWDRITDILTKRKKVRPKPAGKTFRTGPAEKSDPEEKAMCGVGVSGVDIDPYGNVQACMHLQTSAGNLHDGSIKEIWNNSPLFQRARKKSVEAAKQFKDTSPNQYGAPVFCIAVEENAKKGCGSCSDELAITLVS